MDKLAGGIGANRAGDERPVAPVRRSLQAGAECSPDTSVPLSDTSEPRQTTRGSDSTAAATIRSSDVASWISERQASAVVVLRGEIDLANAPQLHECLASCLARGVTDVLVDMTDLSFIDCSAFSAIAVAIKRLDDQGGSLSIRNPPRSARIILEVTGIAAAVKNDCDLHNNGPV